MQKPTLTVQELADTLGVSVHTIYRRRSTSPGSLPKPLDIPGQSILIWLYDDVVRWLARFSSEPLPPPSTQAPLIPPKKRGRPSSS